MTHIVVLVAVVFDSVHGDLAVALLHALQQVKGLLELFLPQTLRALVPQKLRGVANNAESKNICVT